MLKKKLLGNILVVWLLLHEFYVHFAMHSSSSRYKVLFIYFYILLLKHVIKRQWKFADVLRKCGPNSLFVNMYYTQYCVTLILLLYISRSWIFYQLCTGVICMVDKTCNQFVYFAWSVTSVVICVDKFWYWQALGHSWRY